MNPIAASVARPYTVAVGVILVVIASWLAIARIPVQLKPTVDISRISVATSFRGASAAEVEEQLLRRAHPGDGRGAARVRGPPRSRDGACWRSAASKESSASGSDGMPDHSSCPASCAPRWTVFSLHAKVARVFHPRER